MSAGRVAGKVALVTEFLASDEARYVTGLQCTVDAGGTNKP
jgi:NAD(P)-dependent dehydrogenase (short-subunit alcohol dehydrogenase family)